MRISIGVEDADDLIADFANALERGVTDPVRQLSSVEARTVFERGLDLREFANDRITLVELDSVDAMSIQLDCRSHGTADAS